MKRKKWLRPISSERASRLAEYGKRKRQFLKGRLCDGPALGVPAAWRCTTPEIHHSRGRVRALLTDERYWIPLCRRCHHWVHTHVGDAKELGLIGPWGVREPVEAIIE